jgi:hypothetical protein
VREAEELDALIYPVAYDTSDDMGGGLGPQQLPLPGGRGQIILGLPVPRLPIPGTGERGGGGGAGSTRGDYLRADAYLHDLAQKTGARYYRGDTLLGLSQAFAQVAEELRRQYSLGYYPKLLGQEGQRQQIKVRVNQPNLVVVARDSYIYSQQKTDAPQTNDQQQSPADAKGNHLSKTR